MGGVERQGQLEGGVVFVGVAAPVSTAPQPLSADGASALHFAYPRTNDVARCREHEKSVGNAEVLLCCGAGRCSLGLGRCYLLWCCRCFVYLSYKILLIVSVRRTCARKRREPLARLLSSALNQIELHPRALKMIFLRVMYCFVERECPHNLS